MINQHTQVKVAIVYFPEFGDRCIRMQQKMILNGMSMKTFQSYIRNIASRHITGNGFTVRERRKLETSSLISTKFTQLITYLYLSVLCLEK